MDRMVYNWVQRNLKKTIYRAQTSSAIKSSGMYPTAGDWGKKKDRG